MKSYYLFIGERASDIALALIYAARSLLGITTGF